MSAFYQATGEEVLVDLIVRSEKNGNGAFRRIAFLLN
jgi:hypothetical protein